jgi:hypothetical protein
MRFVLDEESDYLPVCLSREGWLIYRTLLALSDRGVVRLPTPPIYLQVSRAALFRAYLCHRDVFEKSLGYKFNGSVETLLLERYALTSKDMLSCFSELYLKNEISLPDDKDEFFLAVKEKYDELTTLTSNTFAAYSRYLSELGLTNTDKKILFLDLGYSGTIQTMLTRALSRDTYGKYFVTTAGPEVPVGEHTAYIHGAFKDNVKWGKNYSLLDRSLFFESFMTAPHGQVIDAYCTDSGKIHFFYGRKIASQRYWSLMHQMQQGAIDYVVKYFEKGVFFDTPELEELYDVYAYNKDFFPGHVKEFLCIDDFMIGSAVSSPIKVFFQNNPE